jgi:hypothetical protein
MGEAKDKNKYSRKSRMRVLSSLDCDTTRRKVVDSGALRP